jgi:glycosyltransferase involved in cell wall biosynthesis
MNEYLFVKPGMAAGGATTADVLTAHTLQEQTGWDVRFLTGYCSQFGHDLLERNSMAVEIEPMLDREHELPASTVADAILSYSGDNTRIVASQFFSPREAHLAEAIPAVAERIPTAIRMHNKLGEAALGQFEALPTSSICLPIHSFMEQHMQQLAPQCDTLVIPPIFDTNRFEPDIQRRIEQDQIVRAQHGVHEDDVLLVQPTNIVARKGAGTALHLAAGIAADTGRNTHLLIAGDVKQSHNIGELSNLLQLSSRLGVDCLVDGLNTRRHRNFSRIGQLLCAADLATMPSYQDDVMLTIPESAYAGVPIYTRAYVDGEGHPLFESVYGSLDCIVQRDMDVVPGRTVLEKAIRVIEGTERLDLEGNATFAKDNFTPQGIAPKLQTLHQLFNERA